jgi:hypothetical protein
MRDALSDERDGMGDLCDCFRCYNLKCIRVLPSVVQLVQYHKYRSSIVDVLLVHI